jgi:hypothetical protein
VARRVFRHLLVGVPNLGAHEDRELFLIEALKDFGKLCAAPRWSVSYAVEAITLAPSALRIEGLRAAGASPAFSDRSPAVSSNP